MKILTTEYSCIKKAESNRGREVVYGLLILVSFKFENFEPVMGVTLDLPADLPAGLPASLPFKIFLAFTISILLLLYTFTSVLVLPQIRFYVHHSFSDLLKEKYIYGIGQHLDRR